MRMRLAKALDGHKYDLVVGDIVQAERSRHLARCYNITTIDRDPPIRIVGVPANFLEQLPPQPTAIPPPPIPDAPATPPPPTRDTLFPPPL